jgi:hypothetical protein
MGSAPFARVVVHAEKRQLVARPQPVVMGVSYRDSYPDTIMARVKSVPLLPCWTWTMFLIFTFWSGALVCLILQNHWWLNQIAVSPKSLFFGVFSALCFRQ